MIPSASRLHTRLITVDCDGVCIVSHPWWRLWIDTCVEPEAYLLCHTEQNLLQKSVAVDFCPLVELLF